ncbi:MAG: hypothetical protein KA120_05440 [Candidatus Goldbacteria bacterium]|nr:hypothetical protein [Candidatus Goldiibacteriota bacterium]
MKKSLIIFVIMSFVFLPRLSAELTQESKSSPVTGWILLGADAVLTGLTIWAIADQITAATDYETLRSKIDGTTDANYYRLLYEKEKVSSRETTALLAGSATGVFLVYTALDYFFLHKAFPVEIKAAYDPVRSGIKISIRKEF